MQEFSRSVFCCPTRKDFLVEILASAEDQEQKDRILNALDKYPSFMEALATNDGSLAMGRIALALSAGDITSNDYDLINGIVMPE